MKWLNNIRISAKLLTSFVLIAVLCGIVGFVGIVNIRTIDDADTKLYEKVTVPIAQVGQVINHFQRMRGNVHDVLILKDMKSKKKYVENVKERRKSIDKFLIEYEKTILTEEGRELYKTLQATLKKFDEEIDKVLNLALTGKDNDAIALLYGDAAKLRVSTQDIIEKTFNSKVSLAKEISDGNTVMANKAVYTMLAVIALSIFFALILGFILSRSIKHAVLQGLGFSKKFAEGDLTARIDLDQEDELGQLGKALNTAAANLETLVSNIIVASQNLAQAVEQIATGNQNLSQRTSEQASSLEEIASTVEQANASIKQNAENSRESMKLAENSSTLAIEGGTISDEATRSVNEISLVSKKIGEITSVINEISFQTNLLALNAAVEAARAGEYGRGFAVVAGEIRNLAQRSGNAAKEIENLIKDTIDKIETGTGMVSRSGTSLKEIITSIKQVSRIINEITAATEEQKQGIEQITIAISEMDTMTQQNAALVEETASASEEMANQAQDLLGMTQSFKTGTQLNTTAQAAQHKELHLKAAEKGSTKTVKKQIASAPATDTFEVRKPKKDIKEVMSEDGFEEF